MRRSNPIATTSAVVALAVFAPTGVTAEGEVNLYSSRHYDTDERLYSDFTDATGITVNRIEGDADELIARMQAEAGDSPADVLLTVDASRLARAKDAGVLQSIDAPVLEARIPRYLQDSDNQWFGFSQRARIIFYDRADVADPPRSYLDLADPAYAGLVCHRSSTDVYSQTLLAAVIENHGEDVATAWARGVVENFARAPQGDDMEQLRGLVSGECDIAVSNSYYYARALRRDIDGLSEEDRANIGWIFPAQNAEGTHMNLSGGGVAAYSPNYDNAVTFMEYMASDQAQQYFSAGNDEYPAVPGVALSPSVAAMGMFRSDKVDLSRVARNATKAQMIFDEVGWE